MSIRPYLSTGSDSLFVECGLGPLTAATGFPLVPFNMDNWLKVVSDHTIKYKGQ